MFSEWLLLTASQQATNFVSLHRLLHKRLTSLVGNFLINWYYWIFHYPSHNYPNAGVIALDIIVASDICEAFRKRCAFSPHTLRYHACASHGTDQIIDVLLSDRLRISFNQRSIGSYLCYFPSRGFACCPFLRSVGCDGTTTVLLMRKVQNATLRLWCRYVLWARLASQSYLSFCYQVRAEISEYFSLISPWRWL